MKKNLQCDTFLCYVYNKKLINKPILKLTEKKKYYFKEKLYLYYMYRNKVPKLFTSILLCVWVV